MPTPTESQINEALLPGAKVKAKEAKEAKAGRGGGGKATGPSQEM